MKRIVSSTLVLLSATISAASAAVPKAMVRLDAAVTTAAPGDSFEIALVFDIQPDWHLYWTNPGETGMAPSVAWELPPGVTVSGLRFPTPTRIKSADGIVSFGYENQLVLLATVSLPKNSVGDFSLVGKVDWLVCHDVCLSESASVSVSIRSGKSVPSDSALKFSAWRESVPTIAELESTFTVDLAAKRGEMSVIVPSDATAADLFPPSAGFAVYETPKVEVIDAGRANERKKISVPFRVLPSELAAVDDYGICTYTTATGRKQHLIKVDYRPNP